MSHSIDQQIRIRAAEFFGTQNIEREYLDFDFIDSVAAEFNTDCSTVCQALGIIYVPCEQYSPFQTINS